MLQLAALLLLGSLVANVLGTVRLAELLTEFTLNGGYLAIGMFALALLLDGMTTVALRTRTAQSLNFVRRHQAAVKQRISRFIRLLAVAAWAVFTLRLAELLEPVTKWLVTWCFSTWTFGAVQISIGNILVLLGAVWAALQISRFIRFVLDEDVLPRIDLPIGVPQAVSMLAYYGILSVGFIVAIAAAGIELTQLTLLISALGVGIGFGLQNVVNNFVSGMILIFERPIKIGDIVEVGTLTGEVRKIGIRASVVKTFSGSEVIVPNGNLISTEVINWTLSDRRRRIEMPVGVAYGTDPNRVIEILLECVRFRDDVHDKPEPRALFQGFGNSSLDFELRFWSSSDSWMQIRSEVNIDINAKLAEAGIEIPFPQRDLHLRSVDPGAGEALGRSRGAPDEQ
jgi:small-conductance mechanosensitive channel